MSKGTSTYCCMHHTTIDESAMTKVTAAPMPSDVSTLDDTPRNGHIPRNCASTTLLTKMQPMTIANSVTVGTLTEPLLNACNISCEISPIKP